MSESNREVFVSVDVETSGPVPGEFSLLSIGACLVDDSEATFECRLKPISERADPAALAVSGLSMAELAKDGLAPEIAMRRFAEWVEAAVDEGGTAVFVGFNAPFDWSFVNYYFHRFAGGSPFGFAALDIKAYYMGRTGSTWRETRSSRMADRLCPRLRGDHDALRDAQYQAELFRLVQTLPVGGAAL